ncbi:hypothetical protein [Streptomyces phytophilus]|uniref:hypothetical protein n=1 Tax=Streptomyces phytophilus TaxID=722715 RepID=UPI0028682FB1|nr:hypothetical protein [Streptomyces phytophilus]
MGSMSRAFTTACGALAGLAAVLLAAGASSGAGEAGTTAPAADGTAAYAVEDFTYPQADRIYQETGILLKRGDGRITMADCATAANVLQVYARGNAAPTCFGVTGNGGFLTLEMKSVYGIRGNDFTTKVDMTVDAQEKSFDVDKNAWTPVGESADPEGREHMLVEIRTGK